MPCNAFLQPKCASVDARGHKHCLMSVLCIGGLHVSHMRLAPNHRGHGLSALQRTLQSSTVLERQCLAQQAIKPSAWKPQASSQSHASSTHVGPPTRGPACIWCEPVSSTTIVPKPTQRRPSCRASSRPVLAAASASERSLVQTPPHRLMMASRSACSGVICQQTHASASRLCLHFP